MMKKRAFTLIELILVIVIFAIISAFGAELYNKIYLSYAHSRAINALEDKTNVALSKIASLLSDRIKDSVIVSEKSGAHPGFVSINRADYYHDTLEWIGSSTQTRELAMTTANTKKSNLGWSGYIDTKFTYNSSVTFPAEITTPASHIDKVKEILDKIDSKHTGFAIVTAKIADDIQNNFGYNKGYSNAVFKAEATGSSDKIKVTAINKDVNSTQNISIDNRYYLAHTAYALVPENVEDAKVGDSKYGKNFDLVLKYNYRPWEGETYNNGDSNVLASNVSEFRFTLSSNGVMMLKLCIRDNGQNFNKDELDLRICKSQAVR